MKFRMLAVSVATVALLFTACDDTKKKEAEAKAEAERIEMEAQAAAMKVEEEAKMAKVEFQKNSITSIAMGNENFSTLVAALKQADLAETFMGEGEFTVFAPTN